MNSKNKRLLLFLIILLAISITWMLNIFTKQKQLKTKNQVTQQIFYDWTKRYEPTSKQPLGLYHWNALLNMHLDSTRTLEYIQDSSQFAEVCSLKKTDSNPTFMFVGENFALLESECIELLNTVKKGSKLYIAYEQLNAIFSNYLFDSLEMGFYYDTTITITTANNEYPFVSYFQNVPIAKSWWAYKNIRLNVKNKDIKNIRSVSGIYNLTNCVEISYGKGKIYLNTIPELFTNYQLLSKFDHKFDHKYYRLWLNTIPKKETIYWLDIARIQSTQSFDNSAQEEPLPYLQFIYDDPMRQLALVLSFIGIGLFLLFSAKRIVPIVPILPKQRNMTRIFANTITSIYFNQREPHTLVKIQRNNFFNIIKKYFQIDLFKEQNSEKFKILSQKTKIKQSDIQNIVYLLEKLTLPTTTDHELTKLHDKILNFYNKAGIISAYTKNKTAIQNTVDVKKAWIAGVYILMGIFIFTFGTYLLVDAIGYGILFWIVATALLFFGIKQLTKH